ncbi:MAG: anti-sigma factor antagonist [Roseofilum sp. Belize BBD 4]|uniref:anti-sigma factor antagonist n=1 Tax=Roseofilum sp. Belize BBD 4 TaxID=2821500 RepID=UPI000E94DBEA|nr:anti-sigma factor antagonist [Roseofilum sp. Belize BBD 4]MBP0032882.1 anti-sigma factor antagonist [Roseofilum sp. Belize BBD 4]HBQ98419.1 anti-anti-sigma factor [Cyanobacteria bacterium UBA11691]
MNNPVNPPEFAMTSFGACCLVQLSKNFTVTQAVAFKDYFKQVCDRQSGLERVILDLGQTTFIDSSGIGALVGCLKIARAQQIELIIWSLHPQVKMAFELTGLTEAFTIDMGTDALLTPVTEIPQTSPKIHPSVRSPLKRLLDIIGSLVGLGITALLFLPIAIAIQIDDPGPIFFGQIRCGWMGKRFRIWKFRSMVANAEALKHQVENEAEGAFFKNKDDPRVTRVGKFLRRTSLDELPQFWNVLRGEMSLVGTRPPTADEIERYEIPKWQRLDVKPGMTGEWQVNGRSSIRDFETVIQMDLRYQENWSLFHDIKLILKTIVVLFQKNAGAM